MSIKRKPITTTVEGDILNVELTVNIQAMKKFWDQRYGREEFIYGISPNEFLKQELNKLPKGTILLPCEGEGRNAVHAAKEGWTVNAFDFSNSGKEKAEKLAEVNQVNINYEVADMAEKDYPESYADVVALIYAHFPPELRKTAHAKAIKWLKPGGILLLEAFNTRQINNDSGGPKKVELLYTEEMLRKDFESLQIDQIESVETTLEEGEFHKGKADVIRLIAKKQ